MREIEELSMNAWPAIQNSFIDGWIIRFANGYTKRANSVNPLYYSSKDIDVKINLCEQIFKKKNLKTVFKMTSQVFPPDLDNILENKGYKVIDNTSVQLLDALDSKEPDFTNIKIYNEISEEWLNDYCKLDSINTYDKGTLKQIFQNINNESYFVSLLVDGKIIACGLGVLENDYIGLFGIIVDKNYRNKGYGEQLINNIIKVGRDKGARKAYLQVVLNNLPALNLYSKLGFKEFYKYWYRVKD